MKTKFTIDGLDFVREDHGDEVDVDVYFNFRPAVDHQSGGHIGLAEQLRNFVRGIYVDYTEELGIPAYWNLTDITDDNFTILEGFGQYGLHRCGKNGSEKVQEEYRVHAFFYYIEPFS